MGSVFIRLSSLITALAFLGIVFPFAAYGKEKGLDDFVATPPIHTVLTNLQKPSGLSPDQIKSVYHLPQEGGSGTVAIIGAYNSKSVESDLEIYSKQFNLPSCTLGNGCLKIHLMGSNIKSDSGWAGETALDTQMIHAIAPGAKILLVEAKSASGKDLLAALDYAKNQKGVVSVSMSWGGGEFSSEAKLDSHFISNSITFFASSGDSGFGVEWPAVSPNVIGVGGTTLHFNSLGDLSSETAWDGSGGGVSRYVSEPSFQKLFNLSFSKRSVPDVSFDSDPQSGFAIYHQGWQVVGGTSAGAPAWAAMKALGKNISLAKLYSDAGSSNYSKYFRDIFRGSNGDCGILCKAGKKYDTVTGLGSPLTFMY